MHTCSSPAATLLTGVQAGLNHVHAQAVAEPLQAHHLAAGLDQPHAQGGRGGVVQGGPATDANVRDPGEGLNCQGLE
jgi:hypothetical protein